MSGLNLEELETSALAKRDTQAASIAKLVDASLDAARLLDKELTPFRKYLHRPAFDITKNTRGLVLELVIHNMTLRLRLETSSDGLSAQSHPLVEPSLYHRPMPFRSHLEITGYAIADAFRKAYRGKLRAKFAEIVSHSGNSQG
jgi:hypothetical protein